MQPLHGLDLLCFGRAVLLGPAMDLAGEVVAGPAVVAEADGAGVHGVQAREHEVHRVEERGALGRSHSGQVRLDHEPAVHVLHDVERGADDVRVLAERIGPWHRDVGAPERGDDAVLAVHRMRRRQELARRLAPEHVLAARRLEVVRGTGLAAVELPHGDGTAEPLDVLAHVALERGHVEPVRLAHLRRDHALDLGALHRAVRLAGLRYRAVRSGQS